MKSLLLPLFCCSVVWLQGQIIEDFSDGNLTENPTWLGDLHLFDVNTRQQLQLNADSAGAARIFVLYESSPEHVIWSLDCMLDFDPSTSNFLTLFYGLDMPDPDMANGFSLVLGETGDMDRLRFYRIENGQRTEIATGTGTFDQAPQIRLEVSKSGPEWTVFTIPVDSTGQKAQEFKLTYPGLETSAGYFGIQCSHTATRTDKFRFDNLIIREGDIIDQEPARITGIEVENSNQLFIQFSEPLDEASATMPANYRIQPDRINILKATPLIDPSLIQLDLEADLTPGTAYELVVSGVKDLAGNLIMDRFPFQLEREVLIQPYDVLINEIFDDPTPVFGLPEAEYVELLVQKDGINLNQLQLKIGERTVSLPDRIVHLGEYLVIIDKKDHDRFLGIPGTVEVEGLPTLVNSGNDLTLGTTGGTIIHVMSYDDTWFRDPSKDEGGWSLELVNTQYPCGLASSWQASTSLTGGTPGYENSHTGRSLVPGEFMINNILPLDSVTLSISVNRNLLITPAADQILINGKSGVSNIQITGPNRSVLLATLSQPLDRGSEHSLLIKNLHDCTGQMLINPDHRIWIPEAPEVGDLVINELLFDPFPGGQDFVEIYNRSGKAIMLQNLNLGNTDHSGSVHLSKPFLIEPAAYIVLTPDPLDLQTKYQVQHPQWIIGTELPAFPNDAGNVTLFTSVNGFPVVIDMFDYNSNMHSPLLKEKEGFSLERLSAIGSSQDINNWHSAAESSGGATPTGQNSQHYEERVINQAWQVDPKTFSPDGDGFDDYLLLNYEGEDPGTFIHVKIFDAAGRLIRYLANNQSISTGGFLQWDGTTDAGQRAPIGIYTIYIQTFRADGRVEIEKESCVLAARLN